MNLAEVARAGVWRIQALADQKEIRTQVEANETAVVIGDPTLLEQAVLALLDNAIKYNRSGGRVMVRTLVQGEQALLEVCDTDRGRNCRRAPTASRRALLPGRQGTLAGGWRHGTWTLHCAQHRRCAWWHSDADECSWTEDDGHPHAAPGAQNAA